MKNSWWGRRNKGFTIVELLIVVVVIAILAAIVIVAFNGVQSRARMAKLQSDTQTIARKAELFKVDRDVYPGSITDCPAPSVTNICITTSGSETYTYVATTPGGSGYMITLAPGYDLTALSDDRFLYSSVTERTGANEFMQYMDLGPIIDKYGLKKYQLSFDIKSANTTSSAVARLYFQNGSTARYGGLQIDIPVTTSYTHHEVTFTPTENNLTVAQSMVAFYGTYSTGNILTVKNFRAQLAQ